MADRRQREERDYEMASARDWAAQQDSFGGTSLRLPDGLSFFRVKKAGNYYLDFIPWRVGKAHPNAAEGKPYWQRTYWAHRAVGPTGASYCCPALCSWSNSRCPICDDIAQQKKAVPGHLDAKAKKEMLDQIDEGKAKHRQLFLVIDREEKEKGTQVWDQSYHLFGKALKAKLDNMDSDEDFDQFAHPKKGYTLKITAVEKSMGNAYFDCSIIDFKKREPYEMSVIDEAPCLCNMPIIRKYDELRRIYLQLDEEQELPAPGENRLKSMYDGAEKREAEKNGGGRDEAANKGYSKAYSGKPAEDEDEDPTPPKSSRSFPDEDEDEPKPSRKPATKPALSTDDDVDEDDAPPPPKSKATKADKAAPNTAEEAGIDADDLPVLVYYKEKIECEVTKVSRDGTSLTLEDDDGEVYRGVAPHEVRLRTPKKGTNPAPKDEDEDEVPPPKRGKSGK